MLVSPGGSISLNGSGLGAGQTVMPSGVIGQTASGNRNLSVGDFIVNYGIFGTNCVSNRFGAKTKIDKLKDKIKEKYNFT